MGMKAPRNITALLHNISVGMQNKRNISYLSLDTGIIIKMSKKIGNLTLYQLSAPLVGFGVVF